MFAAPARQLRVVLRTIPTIPTRTIAARTMSNLPGRDQIVDAAADGQPISAQDVSRISQAESAVTGQGPVKGGPAATARSIQEKQQNFREAAADITAKPASEITHDDARELQSKESKAMGGIRPPKGTIAAQVQSIVDQNEQQGVAGGLSDQAYVTKDDASVAQSAEAQAFGGNNPKGGVAAEMQSAADKLNDTKGI